MTEWTVRAVGGQVPAELAGVRLPASVPGCVHLDLLAAGAIPDPYLDSNEAEVAWIGRVDWRYETTLDWPGDADPDGADPDGADPDGANPAGARPESADQIDLVAYGLDTVATVELNGAELARTANMHRTYRFPVTGLLEVGPNTLAVTFAAPVTAAERASAALGPRPHVNTHPFNAIRKMACNFGWDWGPDLATVGIWRPLVLETWRGVRIAAVRPLVDLVGDTGLLRAHVELERAPGHAGPVEVRVEVGGHNAIAVVAGTEAIVGVAVPAVRTWWPHGYGEQPLYDVRVTAGHDQWAGRVGFRTVALDTGTDERGTRFTIKVNGVPLFARGVNWIPDDCFPSRITRQRYAQRLAQARDANVNLVRVWGGGLYESDDFYDAADELGLLVWQDFAFACAAYAEEQPLRGEVVAEAREAVTRLSPHPSLVLWNGCNENVWGYHDWGWQETLEGRSWGLGYYTELLPRIVAELDPTRPYSPASPYSFAAGRHPNDPDHGTTHIWDVWNERDYTVYRQYVPRFVAEFGFQGPATWATLTRAVPDLDKAGLATHQKATDGAGKLARGLVGHLPKPVGAADWHWATMLNQARAVAFGVEHLRSWWPVCAGAVVWQLNDTWPSISWAAIDGDGRRKPLWYALRRAFRDRLLTLQPRDGELALVAVNDSDQPWLSTVTLTRRRLDGPVLAAVALAIQIPPRTALPLAVPPKVAAAGDARREILLADAAGNRAWWHYAEDVNARLPAQDLTSAVTRIPGGYRVTVTANAFVRDLAVLADRAAPDAVVDEQLVTLLPGETAQFTVRTGTALDAAALTDPATLRSANQLTAGGPPGR
jgi:beta-mannosidase